MSGARESVLHYAAGRLVARRLPKSNPDPSYPLVIGPYHHRSSTPLAT